jgi:hypothetical protein
MFKAIEYKLAKSKVESLIKDYKKLKAILNKNAQELEELYNEDHQRSGDLNYIYSLEDRSFSSLIDALCCYDELVKAVNRIEETEENKFELNRLHKEVDKLEEIEAQFYFEYLTKTPPQN